MVDRQQTVGQGINVCLCVLYVSAGKIGFGSIIAATRGMKYTRKEAIGQYLAAVYVGLGDKDKAFEWLEKDFQARNGKLTEIRWQLQFESLRDDPRFKDMLKRMGLPQ